MFRLHITNCVEVTEWLVFLIGKWFYWCPSYFVCWETYQFLCYFYKRLILVLFCLLFGLLVTILSLQGLIADKSPQASPSSSNKLERIIMSWQIPICGYYLEYTCQYEFDYEQNKKKTTTLHLKGVVEVFCQLLIRAHKLSRQDLICISVASCLLHKLPNN